MYCSESCRQEAFDLYHRVECKVGLLADKKSWESGACMALRMFLIGTNQGGSLNDLITYPDVYARIEGNWDCVNVPYPDDYLAMLNLNWRVNYEETFEDDYSRKSFETAAFLFNALNRIHFFDTERQIYERFEDFSEIELFAGFLLFHNLSVSYQYTGQIDASFVGFGLEPRRNLVVVGLEIPTFQCLMNHSCNANTFTLLNKQRSLTCCLRPIVPGEQIFTAFGCTFWTDDKQKRAEVLKHYKIECKCMACYKYWPTLSELKEEDDVYLTSDEEIIEDIKTRFEWVMEFLRPVTHSTISDIRELSQENLKKALDFRSHLKLLVKQPSRIICFCQTVIQGFIIQSTGNSYITPPSGEILNKYFEIICSNIPE